MTIIWSHPTWKLFHVLTAKLIEKSFDKKCKNEYIALFINICNAIPCMYCRDHASEYMKTINKDEIKTAKDLELFFWRFHNEVNERTKKAPFPKEDLKMYKKKSVKKITREFKIVLQMYYRNQTLSNEFSALMKKNQDKFTYFKKDESKLKKKDETKLKKKDETKLKKKHDDTMLKKKDDTMLKKKDDTILKKKDDSKLKKKHDDTKLKDETKLKKKDESKLKKRDETKLKDDTMLKKKDDSKLKKKDESKLKKKDRK